MMEFLRRPEQSRYLPRQHRLVAKRAITIKAPAWAQECDLRFLVPVLAGPGLGDRVHYRLGCPFYAQLYMKVLDDLPIPPDEVLAFASALDCWSGHPRADLRAGRHLPTGKAVQARQVYDSPFECVYGCQAFRSASAPLSLRKGDLIIRSIMECPFQAKEARARRLLPDQALPGLIFREWAAEPSGIAHRDNGTLHLVCLELLCGFQPKQSATFSEEPIESSMAASQVNIGDD
ncbi:hypothetical protein PAPYR_4641 [Paratrimastix pyriformis]|uniref:Uncharacterized protein n=1 Tax=Paratrimastix pyriformis TaxID=342808 RepID=A0ABQ8URI7_9EUKA|nr:hypothetical protein PAPYR_4641 [Paratrimastix pyriformis]